MLPVVVIPLTVLLIESPSAKTAALEILIRAGGIIVIFLAVLRQSVLLWERDRLLMRERDLLEDAENEIAERKRVQEERENLITELTNKNAELEVFIYTVSHDLKSPLVTIRGFLGFLEQDAVAGNIERHKINARRIANAVDKMRELLSDLLELSRVGRFINKLEKIQFEDLARVAIELVEGRLLAGNVTVEIQPGLPTVYGDRKRLVEVLQNLIDNAAKYMGGQPQPRIEIGYNGEENGSLHFYVRDNGIGIAQEYHERIFGLFEKLDAQSEGTGIGLTLVKRIVEFHGGRIWVESEPQKESTFFFTLPSQPIPDSVI
jgi:signal transduction histidine kinase